MKYKRFFQQVLNVGLKKQTEDTFGEGSFIKISNLTYIRSKKAYLVNVTLHFDDIENSMELYPDGLEYIVKAAWDVLGTGQPIIIQSSVDVIPQ